MNRSADRREGRRKRIQVGSTAATSESVSGSSMHDPNVLSTATETRSDTVGSTGSNSEGNDGIIDRVRSRAAAELSVVEGPRHRRHRLGSSKLVRRIHKSCAINSTRPWPTMSSERPITSIIVFAVEEQGRRRADADAQDLARRQPMMFIGSHWYSDSAGARFLKSSSPDSTRAHLLDTAW